MNKAHYLNQITFKEGFIYKSKEGIYRKLIIEQINIDYHEEYSFRISLESENLISEVWVNDAQLEHIISDNDLILQPNNK